MIAKWFKIKGTNKEFLKVLGEHNRRTWDDKGELLTYECFSTKRGYLVTDRNYLEIYYEEVDSDKFHTLDTLYFSGRSSKPHHWEYYFRNFKTFSHFSTSKNSSD